MQKVNAEYANRVANILENAIASLTNCSRNGVATNMTSEFEALRKEISDTLSVTLDQAESLRADTRRFECEHSTKNDELVKLQTKLRDMREERQERRVELETELAVLRKEFGDMEENMAEDQILKEKSEVTELKLKKDAFDVERKALEENKDTVCRRRKEDQQRYYNKESSLQASISSLQADIHKLSSDHELAVAAEQREIESMLAQLEKQKKRGHELEKHFVKVDMNNFIKKQEEKQLRMVCELEEKAMELLGNGAIGIQRLWRGAKGRELVTKIKSKKKKKGGKSKTKKR